MDAKLRPLSATVLLAVAVLFHAVGLIGIGFLKAPGILRSTPLHLTLMGLLLLLSSRSRLRPFAIWAAITAVVSFWAEWTGVHTGLLFGSYGYGNVLGPKLLGIPVLIGLNWVVVVSGACSIAAGLLPRCWLQVPAAASLAMMYDWVMEPVAIRLDYWSWNTAEIPLFNYVCWWIFAALFAIFWQFFRLRGNNFAAGLFVTQLVFFILLRILL